METPVTGATAPLVGRLLDDRYRLDSVIARGGMATVYVATDTRLDRQVAVKVMHRALAEDADFVRRFTREAQASAKLSCPEVVAIHDAGRDPETGLAYLVMEYVRGINVRQLIVERGPLAPSRAVSILQPVLRALAAAHKAGLVHRDIKPENVLLADDGRVKVADFGLARAVETSTMTQTTGLLIGTVAYLAPEQVESGTADARTDVYASGVLLWELLTGAPPYSGDSPLSVAYKHVHEDVPAPSTAVAGIPAALDELVVRATRRDPEARPADGAAFLAELNAVSGGLPSVAPVAEAPVEHQTLAIPLVVKAPPAPRPPRQKRRGLYGLVVVLVLALLALGGGFYLGSYRYTHAPSVLSLSLQAATTKLKQADLKVKREPDAFSEDVAPGTVLRQSPKPNGRVRKGGTVSLVLSKGPDRRVVPSLTGKDLAGATAALRGVGLEVGPTPDQEYSDSVPAGQVIRSDPASGQRLKPGTAVQLVISKGKEPIRVEDFTGKKVQDAQNKLEKLGFAVTVNQVFSDTVKKDTVMAQSPNSGTAPKGSTITLTVSKGPDLVVVPHVVDKPVGDAMTLLTQPGLKVHLHRLSGGPGYVLDVEPGAGSHVKRGSYVDLYVF